MIRPLYPLEGVISWNMNTTCNYRCSYCTQSFITDRKQWAKDLPIFIQTFLNLPGDWELKLSGGEPFRHPDFIEAVQQLVSGGVRVSVVTNFSASKELLKAYAEATKALPGIFSASLHLEYVKPEEFKEKLEWFSTRFNGSLCVTCVATRDNFPQLPQLAQLFKDYNFKVQPEKQDRDVIDYTPAEQEQLLALGGHNQTGEIAPNFQGQLCWAGARYCIVDHRGEAYRCYPARRYRQEYLGNIVEGSFQLRLEPKPCPYQYCNCTVPQSRGMMVKSSIQKVDKVLTRQESG